MTAPDHSAGSGHPDDAAQLCSELIRIDTSPSGDGERAAGAAHSVVPFRAEASIDGRYVPGYEAELLAEIRQLAGDLVDVDVVLSGRAVQTRFDGAGPDAIRAAIEKEDPGAAVLPACLPIGTDGRHFARLGIRNFGFVPLLLPTGYDFASMFHGRGRTSTGVLTCRRSTDLAKLLRRMLPPGRGDTYIWPAH